MKYVLAIMLLLATPCLADFTFFVVSDTHYGYSTECDSVNTAMIAAVNALPGNAHHDSIGGNVATPICIFHTGDMIQGGVGATAQRDTFADHYFAGSDFSVPVYAMAGNHDYTAFDDTLTSYYGGTTYSFGNSGMRFIVLGTYPDASTRTWLDAHLQDDLSREIPIVLFSHYGFDVHSQEPGWWTNYAAESWALNNILSQYNIAAYIHGHWHWSAAYTWNNILIAPNGSPKAATTMRSFLVVVVSASTIKIAQFSYDPDDNEAWDAFAADTFDWGWYATASFDACSCFPHAAWEAGP